MTLAPKLSAAAARAAAAAAKAAQANRTKLSDVTAAASGAAANLFGAAANASGAAANASGAAANLFGAAAAPNPLFPKTSSLENARQPNKGPPNPTSRFGNGESSNSPNIGYNIRFTPNINGVQSLITATQSIVNDSSQDNLLKQFSKGLTVTLEAKDMTEQQFANKYNLTSGSTSTQTFPVITTNLNLFTLGDAEVAMRQSLPLLDKSTEGISVLLGLKKIALSPSNAATFFSNPSLAGLVDLSSAKFNSAVSTPSSKSYLLDLKTLPSVPRTIYSIDAKIMGQKIEVDADKNGLALLAFLFVGFSGKIIWDQAQKTEVKNRITTRLEEAKNSLNEMNDIEIKLSRLEDLVKGTNPTISLDEGLRSAVREFKTKQNPSKEEIDQMKESINLVDSQLADLQDNLNILFSKLDTTSNLLENLKSTINGPGTPAEVKSHFIAELKRLDLENKTSIDSVKARIDENFEKVMSMRRECASMLAELPTA